MPPPSPPAAVHCRASADFVPPAPSSPAAHEWRTCTTRRAWCTVSAISMYVGATMCSCPVRGRYNVQPPSPPPPPYRCGLDRRAIDHATSSPHLLLPPLPLPPLILFVPRPTLLWIRCRPSAWPATPGAPCQGPSGAVDVGVAGHALGWPWLDTACRRSVIRIARRLHGGLGCVVRLGPRPREGISSPPRNSRGCWCHGFRDPAQRGGLANAAHFYLKW